MTNPYIWADLARATNDPTTIDEAIGVAVAAHNDDPDAHLGDDQSLQSHRASEIIDHLAESVVNDKLKTNARAYIAIVDPSSDSDYDTIAAAITYAASAGGGNILLMPGTHNLSGSTDIPTTVNIVGVDRESSIIACGDGTFGYFNITQVDADLQLQNVFENVQFLVDGDTAVKIGYSWESNQPSPLFRNCKFTGGTKYLVGYAARVDLENCVFETDSDYALQVNTYYYIDKCAFTALGSPSHAGAIAGNLADPDYYGLYLTTSSVNGVGTTTYPVISFATIEDCVISGCNLYGQHMPASTFAGARLSNNFIITVASGFLQFSGTPTIFTGNRIGLASGTGNTVRIESGTTGAIVVANQIDNGVTDSGTSSVVANNSIF